MKKGLIFFIIILFSPFVFCQMQEEDLVMLLGGMVKSDKWIIRKDSFEEEFIGNVRYENDTYQLFADRALSRRQAKIYELSGNVQLSRKEGENILTLNASNILYDQKQDTGFAKGSPKKQVKVIYTTPENIYTLFADKVEFSRKANFFNAAGRVKLSDKENTLQAQSVTFDRESGIFEALSVRPLFTGENKDASYALTADKIIIDTKNQNFKALGQSQGWITLKKDLLSEENLKKLKE